jgi:hypothetical protein
MATAGRRSVVEMLKRRPADDLWAARVCKTAQLLRCNVCIGVQVLATIGCTISGMYLKYNYIIYYI